MISNMIAVTHMGLRWTEMAVSVKYLMGSTFSKTKVCKNNNFLHWLLNDNILDSLRHILDI